MLFSEHNEKMVSSCGRGKVEGCERECKDDAKAQRKRERRV